MGISLKAAFKILLAAAFVVLGAVVYLSSATLNRQIEEQFEREANEKTFIISKLLHHALLISDYHEVQRIAETLNQNPRVQFVEVTNRAGDVIAKFEKEGEPI